MDLTPADIEKYRRWHHERDRQLKEAAEDYRTTALLHALEILPEYFSNYPNCRAYLFGSINRPFRFRKGSDIDIAVENFPGNRIDLFSDLSKIIEYPIDLVIMEKCDFSEDIRNRGLRIK